MKMLAALAVLALTLPATDALAAPAARKVVRKAPVKLDWTKRVAVTAEGGFLIGNPAAKAKLIEYGSLSCPSCRRFHQEASPGLSARIATGDVSLEFRPFAVHSSDAILHALLRCAGPARFLKFYNDFYDAQTALAGTYEEWAQANPAVNPNATAADRIKFSDQWGFSAFAMGHGLTRAQVTACVSDAETIRLQQQREDKANSEFGVTGTPTFVLNGAALIISAWPEIDQAITAALAS